MASKSVLIVDDSFELTRVLQAAILTLDKNLDVKVVPSAEEAMLMMAKTPFDLLITDIRLPGISGMELLPKIRARNKKVNIILITGLTDLSLDDKAKTMGANYFFRKPIEMSLFLETVASFLDLDPPKKSSKISNLVRGMPSVITREEEESLNVSGTLSNLRQEIGAKVVWLINESGKLVAQSSENQQTYKEQEWAPLVLPVLSTGERFTSFFKEISAPQSFLAYRYDQKDIVIVPVSEFALILILARGKGHLHLPLVMDTVLTYQLEIQALLLRMGVLHATPAQVMSQEPQESADLSIDISSLVELNDVDSEEFVKLFNLTPDNKGADAFWDEAALNYNYDLQNPEILTFEQAAKLGLTPPEYIPDQLE
ncbi:MAG: response regulator [Anaerolineaceae bacterium]